MDSVSPSLPRYVGLILLMKVGEFVACFLIGSILTYLQPVEPYVFYEIGVRDVSRSLQNGLYFAVTYSVFSLYPVISFVVLIVALAVGTTRKLSVALVAGIFELAYTAAWVFIFGLSLPVSFWVAWLAMGLATFFLAMGLLPDIVDHGRSEESEE